MKTQNNTNNITNNINRMKLNIRFINIIQNKIPDAIKRKK